MTSHSTENRQLLHLLPTAAMVQLKPQELAPWTGPRLENGSHFTICNELLGKTAQSPKKPTSVKTTLEFPVLGPLTKPLTFSSSDVRTLGMDSPHFGYKKGFGYKLVVN